MKLRSYSTLTYILFAAATLVTIFVCTAIGSVPIPLPDTIQALINAVTAAPQSPESTANIIPEIRLPRVLAAGLVGAALSLAGCALQGLLKNPLADGSTLGVSAGASLGAVIAITFGLTFTMLPVAGTTIMASLFAFLSLVAILGLAYKLDHSLSTNTIILIGIIFGMLISAVISIFIVFATDQLRQIVYWTMGSFANSGYQDVLLLSVVLLVFGGLLLSLHRELNAFAIGEDNAQHIGVNVKRVKLLILVCTAALVGTSVSVSGTIAFVGLVTPHMVRLITGPNHARLMPACFFGGAIFMMLCDLLARSVFSPRELPIGVVTSLIGAALFIYIFASARKVKQ
ncbi:MAG: iron ABC transporter permease [Coriobacteriales bacterium]|jgi:iron complex transport system permease protein|nr:iron ABC transporter permease [Coriobacteriales bacterium]